MMRLLAIITTYVLFSCIDTFNYHSYYSSISALQSSLHIKTTMSSLNVLHESDQNIENQPEIDYINDEERGFPVWLTANFKRFGFSNLTLVQEKSIPKIMTGKDVILQAQTGSGKTLSYALPILSRIDVTRSAIQAVIVIPTRELGLQVASVLKQLSVNSPEKVMIMPLVDGSKNRRQLLWATAEPPHIVVGNPKSLRRLVETGRLRLNSVSFVVIDEVDACLLSPDTKEDLHFILSRKLSATFMSEALEDQTANVMKEDKVFRDLVEVRDVIALTDTFRSSRQTILCSATIPQRQHFAMTCYKNGWTETVPEVIHVDAVELLPSQIDHEYIPCSIDQRMKVLKYVIQSELVHFANAQPTAEEDAMQLPIKMIVFMDDKDIDFWMESSLIHARKAISTYLSKVSKLDETAVRNVRWASVAPELHVCGLFDSMNLDERARSLESFREGTSSVLITSDLAARGLDIPTITHVVQLSIPKSQDDYLHRAGRTGRMRRMGKVITMTGGEDEDFVIRRYMNELQIEIVKRLLKPKK